jgi:uncharacterized membrane protein YheB (UPF0754 family)
MGVSCGDSRLAAPLLHRNRTSPMQTLLDQLALDYWQLTIPILAGVIGWFTNYLAIKMMFFPIEFVGIRPYLGWQGIVPANAVRLAQTGLQLVTTQLLKIPELFDDFDPKALVDSEGDRMRKLVRDSIERKATEMFPQMWLALSPAIREQVFTIAENEIATMSVDVFKAAADNVEQLIDVQRIVTDAVERDKSLMNETFLRVGKKEFKFIEISGLWFGILFGIPQLIVWLLFPQTWVLPFFGGVVGYATNWLALWLVFDPKTPRKFVGITFQGLFHRRQKEIAVEFAEVVSQRVFNNDNLFRELSQGGSRARLLALVEQKADELIARYQKHPMAMMVMRPELIGPMRAEILRDVEIEMFRDGGLVEKFVSKSDKIRKTLAERMAVMDSEGYENVLRPAFKQDEWKLILAGAVLGAVAGAVQLTFYL